MAPATSETAKDEPANGDVTDSSSVDSANSVAVHPGQFAARDPCGCGADRDGRHDVVLAREQHCRGRSIPESASPKTVRGPAKRTSSR